MIHKLAKSVKARKSRNGRCLPARDLVGMQPCRSDYSPDLRAIALRKNSPTLVPKKTLKLL